jgi:hypothetical protein
MKTSMRRIRVMDALVLMCSPMQGVLAQTAQQKGVMLMNRIGPSASTLYVANVAKSFVE